MSLYTAKKANGGYRISKVTDDLEFESSYITTEDSCECPAGHRPSCRHREMLPDFLARGRVGTAWMLDYDNGQWFWYNVDQGTLSNTGPSTKRNTFEGGLRRRI